MGIEDPSGWDKSEEIEESEEDKRLRLRRTLMMYAYIGAALSVFVPLAGFLYVRMESRASVPVPNTAQFFSQAVPLSPSEKAMMPASPSTVLAQQQGKGSLNYIYVPSDVGYASAPKPQPAPVIKTFAPPPQPTAPPPIAATTPPPASMAQTFSSPQLDPNFDPGSTTSKSTGTASGAPTNGATPDISSVMKNLPPSVRQSLNKYGLGSLIGGGQQTGSASASGSTPQLDNSNGP